MYAEFSKTFFRFWKVIWTNSTHFETLCIFECTAHYQTDEEGDGDHDDELVGGHQLEVVHGLPTQVRRHHADEVTCDDDDGKYDGK